MIWHCLENYDYTDAVFLSERWYAEGMHLKICILYLLSCNVLAKSDESLYLLATSYYRNGQINDAYYVLKDRHNREPQCRYLFSLCAFQLQR